MNNDNATKLPSEIIKSIALYLNKVDRLSCLTLCKAWYKTLINLIYEDVTFKTLKSFRIFLHTITHHSNVLRPGRAVRTIQMNIDSMDECNFGEKEMVFTEFELLARHCPFVTQLTFRFPHYWRFLHELDLDHHWLYLSKLSDSDGSGKSRKTMVSLGHRLTTYGIDTSLSLSSYGITREHILQDISMLPSLKAIRLKSKYFHLYIQDIVHIFREHPQLEELSLWVKMKTAPDTDDIPTYSNKEQHIHTLGCLIDNTQHPWIPFIKRNFSYIDTLAFQVAYQRNQEGIVQPMSDRTKADILDSILGLFHNEYMASSQDTHKLSVRRLHINLGKAGGLLLAIYMSSIIYMTSAAYVHFTISTSLHINFIHDFFEHMPMANSETEFLPLQSQVHHSFNIVHPFDPMDNNQGLIEHLKLATESLTYYITELTIKETRKYMATFSLGFQCLDTILEHFTYLKTLTFVLSNTYLFDDSDNSSSSLGEIDEVTYVGEVTLSHLDASTHIKHDTLTSLTVKEGKMNTKVFSYLFNKCPHLSSLSIRKYGYDEESLLILECLCLENNVNLVYLS
ncbi:hypothetical protein RMATCC62417_13825 [Rhizopus microsporus]|nr:hypothetical protein RMATCC62417_13825 [Rhizopus microsporus]